MLRESRVSRNLRQQHAQGVHTAPTMQHNLSYVIEKVKGWSARLVDRQRGITSGRRRRRMHQDAAVIGARNYVYIRRVSAFKHLSPILFITRLYLAPLPLPPFSPLQCPHFRSALLSPPFVPSFILLSRSTFFSLWLSPTCPSFLVSTCMSLSLSFFHCLMCLFLSVSLSRRLRGSVNPYLPIA